MRELLKTVLPFAALAVLMAQPAGAQFNAQAQRNQERNEDQTRCQNSGGRFQDGRCVMPPPQQPQGGQRGGGRGNNQQNAQPQQGAQQQQQQQQQQQGGQRGGPRGNNQQNAQPQQGAQQQQQQQGGQRGGARGNNQQNAGPPQQGGQQQQQQGGGQQQFGGRNNNQQGGGQQQFGNERRDQQQFGGRDNNAPNRGQFGDNNFGRFGNGRRDLDRFDNDRRVFGRDYDRRDFSVRFYGRYGSDPREFERQRELFRARQNWREGYAHDYVFADDPFYSDCRSDNIVGNTILGTILGGFVGNVASGGRGDATVAGMIFGGATGAALSRGLDCEDRYFVYRTYYDGFDRGLPGAQYPWRNPRTGLYGTLVVGDYYSDYDGYRCATYTQEIFIRGRRELTRGHACQQDDGSWVMID